jgi:hypothetical protein
LAINKAFDLAELKGEEEFEQSSRAYLELDSLSGQAEFGCSNIHHPISNNSFFFEKLFILPFIKGAIVKTRHLCNRMAKV